MTHHARSTSRSGVIYLPTTSYMEMNEWTLPGTGRTAVYDRPGRARKVGQSIGRYDMTDQSGVATRRHLEAISCHALSGGKLDAQTHAGVVGDRLAALPEAARTYGSPD
jgi:hypothetical protein